MKGITNHTIIKPVSRLIIDHQVYTQSTHALQHICLCGMSACNHHKLRSHHFFGSSKGRIDNVALQISQIFVAPFSHTL